MWEIAGVGLIAGGLIGLITQAVKKKSDNTLTIQFFKDGNKTVICTSEDKPNLERPIIKYDLPSNSFYCDVGAGEVRSRHFEEICFLAVKEIAYIHKKDKVCLELSSIGFSKDDNYV